MPANKYTSLSETVLRNVTDLPMVALRICCVIHQTYKRICILARIELVIFDCDGVLVDSELLSAEVLKSLMAEFGMPISWEIFCADFLGRSFSAAADRMAVRFGKPLPPTFQVIYRQRLLAHMRGRLKAMTGVEGVLASLRVPFCLATSSSPQRLAVTLEETGLGHWFQDRKFTASEVAQGKPAPDLFFHAADKMGIARERCLIIEDSEMGVRAGLAAGATVWHFTGGSHMNAGAKLPQELTTHRVLDSMAALHQAFIEIGVS
jgi:HAD superfamily hydrolase (TIGR01509 family)